jgi:hypothetical protein
MAGLADPPGGREPRTRSEDRASHDPDRPQVGIASALVPEPRHRARLREQLVERRPLPGRHVAAHLARPALELARARIAHWESRSRADRGAA